MTDTRATDLGTLAQIDRLRAGIEAELEDIRERLLILDEVERGCLRSLASQRENGKNDGSR